MATHPLAACLRASLGPLPRTAADQFCSCASPPWQLPAYGIMLVHAGLVPGLPPAAQDLGNLIRMRDVLPAAAAAAVAAGDEGGPQALGAAAGFDWEAATQELASLAAAAAVASDGGSGSSGGNGSDAAAASASDGQKQDGEGDPLLGSVPGPDPRFALVGSERPSPAGRAWAALWQVRGWAGLRLHLGSESSCITFVYLSCGPARVPCTWCLGTTPRDGYSWSSRPPDWTLAACEPEAWGGKGGEGLASPSAAVAGPGCRCTACLPYAPICPSTC